MKRITMLFVFLSLQTVVFAQNKIEFSWVKPIKFSKVGNYQMVVGKTGHPHFDANQWGGPMLRGTSKNGLVQIEMLTFLKDHKSPQPGHLHLGVEIHEGENFGGIKKGDTNVFVTAHTVWEAYSIVVNNKAKHKINSFWYRTNEPNASLWIKTNPYKKETGDNPPKDSAQSPSNGWYKLKFNNTNNKWCKLDMSSIDNKPSPNQVTYFSTSLTPGVPHVDIDEFVIELAR